jgi:isopentenyldiphosphate isomerase
VTKDIDPQSCHIQDDEVSEIRWVGIEELHQRVDTDDDTLVPHPEEFPLLFTRLLPKH